MPHINKTIILALKIVCGVLMFSGTLGVTHLLFLPNNENINLLLLTIETAVLWLFLLLCFYAQCKKRRRMTLYSLLAWVVAYGFIAVSIMRQLSR